MLVDTDIHSFDKNTSFCLKLRWELRYHGTVNKRREDFILKDFVDIRKWCTDNIKTISFWKYLLNLDAEICTNFEQITFRSQSTVTTFNPELIRRDGIIFSRIKVADDDVTIDGRKWQKKEDRIYTSPNKEEQSYIFYWVYLKYYHIFIYTEYIKFHLINTLHFFIAWQFPIVFCFILCPGSHCNLGRFYFLMNFNINFVNHISFKKIKQTTT